MEENKMTAKELRKKIGVRFPKGLAEANYNYETYLFNQITEIGKEKQEIIDRVNEILANFEKLSKEEIFAKLNNLVKEHE